MTVADRLRYAGRAAFAGHVARSWLVVAAVAAGVLGVILLAAVGEGARAYVIQRFSALGTHLLVILPGRNETTGGHPPMMGETSRDLTLDDALALTRLRLLGRIAPLVLGAAPVAWGGREREANLVGTTPDFLAIRQVGLAQGVGLPPGDPNQGAPVCLLGETVRQELFGGHSGVGEWVRIGESRFRVTGVIGNSGQSFGLDLDEVVLLPVASAMRLFNTGSLFRILAEVREPGQVEAARDGVRRLLAARHEGEEDVTILAQDALLSTFNRVLGALTLAVAGIGGISLVVSGILIMNVLWISVSQRRAEIGLLKALGASRGVIASLFLLESLLLSTLGGLVGVGLGMAAIHLMARFFPGFPMGLPGWAIPAALITALATAVSFGIIPARKAARLDPVQALTSR